MNEYQKVMLALLGFLILVSLTIGVANARSEELVIEPKNKIIGSLKLGVHDEIIGNISVQDGFVDFYVYNPSGGALLFYNQTSGTSFNFTVSENGNYTFCFINSLEQDPVTVFLNYGIVFVVESSLNVGIDFSTGVAQVITLPPIEPPDDFPDLENLFEKYLNLQESDKILRIAKGASQYVPLRNIVIALSSILFTITLALAKETRHLSHKLSSLSLKH